MRVGIISEGHTDRAVISGILIKAASLDIENIKIIKPTYVYDETDLSLRPKESFSNWYHVKKECETKELIGGFLSIEGNDYIVIHIDTAEAELYEVNRPEKNSNDYCSDFRNKVIAKIIEWLQMEYVDKLLFAVAIEEIEAWLLALYTSSKDTTTAAKPKEKLRYELGKLQIKFSPNEIGYLELVRPIIRMKEKQLNDVLARNCSLKEFFYEIKSKVG